MDDDDDDEALKYEKISKSSASTGTLERVFHVFCAARAFQFGARATRVKWEAKGKDHVKSGSSYLYFSHVKDSQKVH